MCILNVCTRAAPLLSRGFPYSDLPTACACLHVTAIVSSSGCSDSTVAERYITNSKFREMGLKLVFLLTVLVFGGASAQCNTPWEDCGKLLNCTSSYFVAERSGSFRTVTDQL